MELIYGRIANPSIELDVMERAMRGLAPQASGYRFHADGYTIGCLCSDDACGLERVGPLLVAADLQLHNRDELRQRLHGNDPVIASDTQLLGEAYLRWGDSCLAYIEGEFAFAIWETRNNRLFLARDRLGVRPIFWRHDAGRGIAFASFEEGLLGTDSGGLDETKLVQLLLHDYREQQRTLHRAVNRLPPGHILSWQADRVCVRRYWSLHETIQRTTPDFSVAVEQLQHELERAVMRRLPHATPLAAHVSGGLDSSALALIAARLAPEDRVYAYSYQPMQETAFRAEGEAVEPLLSGRKGIEHIPVTRPDKWPIQRILSYPGRPLGLDDPEHRFFEHANRQGASLLLSGFGGNEGVSYSGGGALASQFLRGEWRTLFGEMLEGRNGVRRLAAELLLPLLRREGSDNRHPFLPWLSPGWLRRGEIFEQLEHSLQRPISVRPYEQQIARCTDGLLTYRMESWALMGARHCMAVSYPLLDPNLLAWVLGLPTGIHQRGGWNRALFRAAVVRDTGEEFAYGRSNHGPFPCLPLSFVRHRDAMQARIARLRRHAVADQVLHLAAMEQALVNLPCEADVRSAQADAARSGRHYGVGCESMIHPLLVGDFLEQHF